MFQLKSLDKKAVQRALEKAERYRLLNEPMEAESICEDVLRVEPDNQQAMVTLLLALTEQFDHEFGEGVDRAQQVATRLRDEYSRAYYHGIVCERHAKSQLRHGGPGSGGVAYESLREAMAWFEKAEAMRPPGNDDALLRWNACVRILERHRLSAPPAEMWEPPLE